MMIALLMYLLSINLLSGYAMWDDKRRAKVKGWRIPEANLLLFCLAGGFFGTYWGMRVIRHKTQHGYFHVAVIVAFFLWFFVLPLSAYILIYK